MRSARFSSKSEVWYAASDLSLTECASAASHTSRGMVVRSAAHTRKLDRKPCAVASIPSRPSTCTNARSAIGRPVRPGNVRSARPVPSARASARISSARADNGTRCSRPPFMRLPGIVQDRRVGVEFAPCRESNLARAGRTQDQKLEREPGPDPCLTRPDTDHGVAHAVVGKRAMPLRLDRLMLREHRLDCIGRIVRAMPLRHRHREHRPDALAQPLRRRRLRVPNRGEHAEHVIGRDVVHRALADQKVNR